MTQNPMYPQQPPPLPGQPTYGQPPYGQPMYGQPYGYPQPMRGNGAAVAGLLFAIAGFCVPILSGLVGLIFGLVGLKKSRQPNTDGRGMSIAAIVIGLLSIIIWGVGGSVIAFGGYYTYRSVTSALAIARPFVRDLSTGNIAGAQANATSALSAQDLTDVSNQIQHMGTFNDLQNMSFNENATPSGHVIHLGGLAMFRNRTAQYDINLQKQNGIWKVSGINLRE